jgi:hypothetical protein
LPLAWAVGLPGACWPPLVSLAAIGTFWVWQELGRFQRPAQLAASGVLSLLLLAGPWACGPRLGSALAVATLWQSRHDYLLAREPSYRAASLLNRIVRAGERVYCQDASPLYFACPTAIDGEGQLQAGPPRSGLATSNSIARAARAGCSYLLLAQPVEQDGRPSPSSDIVPLADAPPPSAEHESAPIGEVIPILEYCFADDNNRCIRYRLLRLR